MVSGARSPPGRPARSSPLCRSSPPFPTASLVILPSRRRWDLGTSIPSRCSCHQSPAHQRRISKRTAELSRLIPGGHKLNTAEMLKDAARHAKFLQSQAKVPSVTQEQMHALLACGGMQKLLAGEGKCLVPTKLVHTIAKHKTIKSIRQTVGCTSRIDLKPDGSFADMILIPDIGVPDKSITSALLILTNPGL